jgi:hypothetical protein
MLMLAQGAVPAGADGLEKPPARGSDARQFLEELQSNGAFKFYEDTEDILRAGKFERAFGRYCFLNTHIRGQAIHAGLAAMVDQRLHFLKEQMHLAGEIQCYEPEERPTRRRAKQVKPPCPPPPPKAARPCPEEKPPEIVIPPAAQDNKGAESHQDEAKPPGEQAPKSAPAPSFWEKLQRKVKIWQ